MRRLAALVDRLAAFTNATSGDERRRLATSSLLVIVALVCLLSPAWILTYLWLDRPLSAAIPAIFMVVALASVGWLARTRRSSGFIVTSIGLMLVLPFALQWSLGGFAHGSGVALWAFTAPLGALVAWGYAAAATVFVVFAGGVIASAIAEPILRANTEPLPTAVTNAFLALDVIAPLATALVAVAFFMRQRDRATRRSEELLLSILPESVAERLKRGAAQIADRVGAATVLFVDIVGFTARAERTPPERVVELLGRVFTVLDALAERHGLDKIKTLGDGYLAAAGLAGRGDHAAAAASMALEVRPALREALAGDWGALEVRIGLASGPVVAGVIGRRRFSYDIWGDTVNMASRMASSAEPGTIQLSSATRDLLVGRFRMERWEGVEIKGKGRLTTYRLTQADG